MKRVCLFLISVMFVPLFINNVHAQLVNRELRHLDITWDQMDADNVDGWNLTINGEVLQISKDDVTSLDSDTYTYRVFSVPNTEEDFQFKTSYDINISAYNSDATSAPSDTAVAYFLAEDINVDGAVDGLDLVELAENFGTTGLAYEDNFDITGDGNCDGLDLTALSNEFGQVIPANVVRFLGSLKQ